MPTGTISSLASLVPSGGLFASMAPLRLRVAATGAMRQALLAVQLQGGDESAPASAVEVYTVHFEGRSAGLQHAATLQVWFAGSTAFVWSDGCWKLYCTAAIAASSCRSFKALPVVTDH